MPLYDFSCGTCGKVYEFYMPSMSIPAPTCRACNGQMTRSYGGGRLLIKAGYPRWIDRIDDIHKAQEQRGERLRMPHPSEVRAT